MLSTGHICLLNELSPMSLQRCRPLVRTQCQLFMLRSNDIESIALNSSLVPCLFCHLLSIQIFFTACLRKCICFMKQYFFLQRILKGR